MSRWYSFPKKQLFPPAYETKPQTKGLLKLHKNLQNIDIFVVAMEMSFVSQDVPMATRQNWPVGESEQSFTSYEVWMSFEVQFPQ